MTSFEVPTFLETFKQNPIWIALAVLMCISALMTAVLPGLILLDKNPRVAFFFGAAAVSLGVLCLFAGFMGSTREHARRDEVVQLPNLSAHNKEALVAYANASANWNILAGVAASALPIILGGVIIVIARTRKPAAT